MNGGNVYLLVGEEKEVHDTKEFFDGLVYAHIDADGKLIGVEVLGVKEIRCPASPEAKELWDRMTQAVEEKNEQ